MIIQLVNCITIALLIFQCRLHRHKAGRPLGINESPADELHLLGITGRGPRHSVLSVSTVHVSVARQRTGLEQAGFTVLRTVVWEGLEEGAGGGGSLSGTVGSCSPGAALAGPLVVLALLVEPPLDVVAELHHEPP